MMDHQAKILETWEEAKRTGWLETQRTSVMSPDVRCIPRDEIDFRVLLTIAQTSDYAQVLNRCGMSGLLEMTDTTELSEQQQTFLVIVGSNRVDLLEKQLSVNEEESMYRVAEIEQRIAAHKGGHGAKP